MQRYLRQPCHSVAVKKVNFNAYIFAVNYVYILSIH